MSADFIANDEIVWDGDIPRLKHSRKLTRDSMNALAQCALSLPYVGVWDSELQQHIIPDPSFYGKSIGEVLLLQLANEAINGDAKARTEMLDRTMGKPKQSVDATVTTMTFNDFLEASAMDSIIDISSDYDYDYIEGV